MTIRMTLLALAAARQLACNCGDGINILLITQMRAKIVPEQLCRVSDVLINRNIARNSAKVRNCIQAFQYEVALFQIVHAVGRECIWKY